MKIFKAIDLSYSNFTNAVQSYLSKTFSDWGQRYDNSTVFGQIITVMRNITQNVMLYIEDAFVEQNKFTATRKKSIYGLAQLTGYNPSLGKAAGAQIKLSYTPNNIQNLNIVIPNHTSLACGQNGMLYQIILPQDAIVMSIEKDNTNKYLYIVEGKFETQTFVSTGGKLYLQHINFTGDIDDDYIEVLVNNEKWDRAESLYDMEPDGKQWFYKTSIMGGIVLGFGNDVYGRSLKDGDIVSVTYLKHNGEHGNLNATEFANFLFVDSLKNVAGEDVDGNSIFNISLASQENVTAGTFSETQDQVKQMIGYNSRALVLASTQNYSAFINRFSFCGYNRTWSDTGSLVVNSLIMRNYKSQLNSGMDYFNLTEKDFFLTQEQKDSVKTCIENSGRQLAGVTYNIYDPELKKYALYMYIKMKDGSYDTDYVKEQIRQYVGEFFSNISNDMYVPKSDLIQLIKNNISEIDGVNCYFLSADNEEAIIQHKYVNTITKYDPSTGTYNKQVETVWVDPGEDPGLGLDAHGNIYLENPEQYPVLMGGWSYQSTPDDPDQLTHINDPLIISFE